MAVADPQKRMRDVESSASDGQNDAPQSAKGFAAFDFPSLSDAELVAGFPASEVDEVTDAQ